MWRPRSARRWGSRPRSEPESRFASARPWGRASRLAWAQPSGQESPWFPAWWEPPSAWGGGRRRRCGSRRRRGGRGWRSSLRGRWRRHRGYGGRDQRRAVVASAEVTRQGPDPDRDGHNSHGCGRRRRGPVPRGHELRCATPERETWFPLFSQAPLQAIPEVVGGAQPLAPLPRSARGGGAPTRDRGSRYAPLPATSIPPDCSSSSRMWRSALWSRDLTVPSRTPADCATSAHREVGEVAQHHHLAVLGAELGERLPHGLAVFARLDCFVLAGRRRERGRLLEGDRREPSAYAAGSARRSRECASATGLRALPRRKVRNAAPGPAGTPPGRVPRPGGALPVSRYAVPKSGPLYRSTRWAEGLAIAVLAAQDGLVVGHTPLALRRPAGVAFAPRINPRQYHPDSRYAPRGPDRSHDPREKIVAGSGEARNGPPPASNR